MKYVYPAILTPENGGYAVAFPDVKNAFTCGDTLTEALEMAQDVLCLCLMDMEDRKEPIPEASEHVETQDGEQATLIVADVDAYRRKVNERAVKKTLSIPQWMNEAALKKGINFSQVLQEALTEKLAET